LYVPEGRIRRAAGISGAATVADEHGRFIFHMEARDRLCGRALFVESIPPEKMREILAKVNSPKE
jgi:hypothetical protein